MKALKIADSGKLEIVEAEKPEPDGERVLVEVEYVGICGSDISMWAIGGPFKGNILGHEFVGLVVDPGPRGDLKAGDRVTGIPLNFCGECRHCKRGKSQLCPETPRRGGPGVTIPGADCPYFAIRADFAIKVSDKIDPKVAALAEPAACGRHSASLGNIEVGDKILVIGGGIIAIMTAWWAKQFGAGTIVMAEVNPARIEHLKANSVADKVVNFREEGTFEEVKELAGEGFDVVFECAHPSDENFNKLIVPLIRAGGTIVQTGAIIGPLTIDFYPFLLKEIRYQACWSYAGEDFIEAVKAVERNAEEFSKHITSVIPMEKAQETFIELASGKSKDVKVMIDPRL
jgi:2-desacetyl-2-hydroxyethyl bacteriochlorophyllide A dehydrogenase